MIDVSNSSSINIDEKSVIRYVNQMLKFLKVNPKSDVSILFVDEDEMTKQHVRWMNEDGPTDVMSFPMDNVLLKNSKSLKKQATLGDIIICPSVALKDARKQSINPAYHLVFLLAHGILHLLGLDHQEKSQRGVMQKKEQGIMNSLRTVKKH
jgi:probable rRNA maturation factor